MDLLRLLVPVLGQGYLATALPASLVQGEGLIKGGLNIADATTMPCPGPPQSGKQFLRCQYNKKKHQLEPLYAAVSLAI